MRSGYSRIDDEQVLNRQARKVREEEPINLGGLGALRGSIFT
jgi:hypothetical protein